MRLLKVKKKGCLKVQDINYRVMVICALMQLDIFSFSFVEDLHYVTRLKLMTGFKGKVLFSPRVSSNPLCLNFS